MAEFNFDSLTPEVADLPKRGGGRGRKVQHNPFIAWVQESYDSKTGRAVTVPNEHVKDTVYLIRAAARDLGIGVRVVTSLTAEEMEKASKTAKVKVTFQGKEKKKYTGRRNSGQASTPAPAAATPAVADKPAGTAPANNADKPADKPATASSDKPADKPATASSAKPATTAGAKSGK